MKKKKLLLLTLVLNTEKYYFNIRNNYTIQLIDRTVRECCVYSELVPYTITTKEILERKFRLFFNF